MYAAGRLDYDSEGLVLLTDDGQLQARIANPQHKTRKHYLCQVSGTPTEAHATQLLSGVLLNDGPARAVAATPTPSATAHPRVPVVTHPHAMGWIEVIITEGRNRQVRRMLAAVGLPVLRLIRTQIGPWRLEGLAPGESRSLQLHAPQSTRATLRARPRR